MLKHFIQIICNKKITCPYCHKECKNDRGVRRHVGNTEACQRAMDKMHRDYISGGVV